MKINEIQEVELGNKHSGLTGVKLNDDGTLYLEFEMNPGVEYEGNVKIMIDNVDFNVDGISIKRGQTLFYSSHNLIPIATTVGDDIITLTTNMKDATLRYVSPNKKAIDVTMKEIEKMYGRKVRIINK